jgi:hypothetical protein
LLGLERSIPSAGRRSRRAGTVGLGTILVFAALAPVASAHGAGKVVRYLGYRMVVPRSWPVYDLSRDRTRCVRFDLHAVYLGHPGSDQRCPAHVVGRSEAILVEPLSAIASSAGGATGPAVRPAISRRARASEGFSAELAIPSHGVIVTATWSANPGKIARALGVRSLRALRSSAAPVAGTAGARPRARALAAGAVYTGLGFDVCSTPSTSAMAAWGSSPYRAIGVYIGGANMACSQPNLTSSWVSQESLAGWHLILIYVGLQAPSNSCGCGSISSANASSEGAAAASDAIAQAQALGIGPGNPIYDDMEGYAHTSSNTSAVLAFLSGWTTQLHTQGYLSGVYSSTGSGIADLVGQYGTGYAEPDDLWIADWNGQQTTSDPAVPPSEWANHQRLHQYDGGSDETWNGVTLNIDHNYVDGATAGASACVAQFPDGTFVEVSGSYAVYRIAGGAPLFVSDWSRVGGEQPVTVISQQQFDTLCPVPTNGTFLGSSAGGFYRVAGGTPLPVTDWSAFGGPQPYVAIDQWDIDNVNNAAAHLYTPPADGTVLQGLPSNTSWSFKGGYRTPVGAQSGAVAVNDSSLAPFPIVACVVPRLRHFTIQRVRRAVRNAHCVLGKVHRPRHWPRHHRLRVVWQIPQPGVTHSIGWLVGVRLR